MINARKLLDDISRQIADYKRHVADQEAKLARLAAKGPPPQDAVDLLKQFRATLRIAEDQQEFLRRKLGRKTVDAARGPAGPLLPLSGIASCAKS